MSKRERPPPIPANISEYDGHDDYRERFRRVPFWTGLARTAVLWASIVVAVGCGYGFAKIALLFADPSGSSGLVAFLTYSVVGLIGFVAFLVMLGYLHAAASLRGVLAAGVLFFSFMAFYPFAADYRAPLGRTTPADPVVSAAVLDALRGLGRVGAPGEVPPMLAVSEHDGWVDVRNKTGAYLLVEIAQVRPNSRAAGGWDRCGLWQRGRGGAGLDASQYRLGPYLTMRLVTNSLCAQRSGGAYLEYRIGDETTPAAETWWSDSTWP